MISREQKNKLIDQLRRTPVIQIACERAGVSRATYYRWRKEDPEFAKATNEALTEGTGLMNDMAESQLLASIRDKNFSAIAFWLKHKHPEYGNRLEVTAKIKEELEPLTPEQEETVKQALKLASLSSIYPLTDDLYEDSKSSNPTSEARPDRADAQGPAGENGNGE
ncbi:hypothetical protein A3F52_00830 [Candidatus Uhrbacteria bacterium RIFCSPHIGHO2_12_FULL_47_11]|nr:MAG: hypothetical protein A2753_02820 [Candidatus Uhrbacteria bacterium RIFCSPHIGHO2_01_FULL_47_11]OGL74590.1 MAG: hypothetical protein A3F52_00830 [Candidatus Uhrbacteria bacterium RIFCSPHIGHO2_12_FULL_47_11]